MHMQFTWTTDLIFVLIAVIVAVYCFATLINLMMMILSSLHSTAQKSLWWLRLFDMKAFSFGSRPRFIKTEGFGQVTIGLPGRKLP